MRKLIFLATISLFMCSSFIWAGGAEFWSNLEQVKSRYHPKTTNYYDQHYLEDGEDIVVDGNSSRKVSSPKLVLGDEGFTLKSEETKSFNAIFLIVKNEPYKVLGLNTSTFDTRKLKADISLLATSIPSHGSDQNLSLLQKRIELASLRITKRAADFLHYLAGSIETLDDAKLKKVITKELKFISTVTIAHFKKQREEVAIDDPDEEAIASNYSSLLESYMFYRHMIFYLSNNISFMEYTSYLTTFNLDQLIKKINASPSLAKLSHYLSYIRTDPGRFMLFLAIVVITVVLSNLLTFLLMPLLRVLLKSERIENPKTKLRYLTRIKQLLSYVFITFGLQMATEVLAYPNEIPVWFADTLFIIYILLFAKIATVTIDVLLDVFLTVKFISQDIEFKKELVNLIILTGKIVIYITALLTILGRMDIDYTTIVASLGIGGFAVALAAKDTIAAFFASIQVILDNTFSHGDWIETSVGEGHVIRIGLANTTVRTFDNAMITIPNTILVEEAVRNWSKREVGRRIKMHIGITYSSKKQDVKKAIEEIREMLKAHPNISTTGTRTGDIGMPKLISSDDQYGVKNLLLVYMDSFSDSSIDILVYCFSKSVVWRDWLAVKEDVMFKIWEILERNNLEMAFPSQSLYIAKDDDE